MAFETRVEKCWKCEYFLQTSEGNAQGYCVRHAPSKLAQVEGLTVAPLYPGLEMFQALTDGTITFCGEFKQMQGTIPPEPV